MHVAEPDAPGGKRFVQMGWPVKRGVGWWRSSRACQGIVPRCGDCAEVTGGVIWSWSGAGRGMTGRWSARDRGLIGG